MTTTSEGGTGQEQESRLRRILRRAREFYDTYTAGLRRGDFKRLFTEETRGIYQYFGPTGEEREEKTSRFVRAARLIGRIFWGFLMALAPARRILYGIAFLLFLTSAVIIVTAPPNSAIKEEVPVFSVYAFIILSFLLALELADKLSARDEIEIARDVQLSLQPPADPDLPGLEVASFTAPAAEVGGDYHDFETSDGKAVLVIGDVSGHGLASGLVMAMAKSALHAQLLNDPAPDRVLSTLNSIVGSAGDQRTLMTLLFVLVDSGSGEMTWSNAGHIYPLLVRADDRSPQWLESVSYPLGVRSDQGFFTAREELKTGDTVYLISDGLIEAINQEGESYGYERFYDCVQRNGGGQPRKVIESVLKDVSDFARQRPLEDDLTIIVFKYLGANERKSES